MDHLLKLSRPFNLIVKSIISPLVTSTHTHTQTPNCTTTQRWSVQPREAPHQKTTSIWAIMDFSLLSDALSSHSYHKIADICDNLMLQAAAEGIAFHDEWPYAIHLLGHIYVDDINSARFLWKSIPVANKGRCPEIGAVWKIGQRLWTKDYAGVHQALRDYNWGPELQGIVASFAENYTRSIFELLLSAYSTIGVQDTALFMGMSEDEATKYVLEQGWTLDSSSQMLTVERRVVSSEQKVDPSKLQRLTEYVFHLEH